MERRSALTLLAAAALGGAPLLHAEPAAAEDCSQPHLQWVGDTLQRMQTILPGMTRKTLLTVFTTEGGLSTPLNRTYVCRDCRYFKVNVEFKPVDRPERDEDGRISMIEGDNDEIVKISQPFLQFTIAD